MNDHDVEMHSARRITGIIDGNTLFALGSILEVFRALSHTIYTTI